MISVRSQTIVPFDDIHAPATGIIIPSGYQGLSWSNFAVLNAVLFTGGGTNGYFNGMVTVSNVAYNPFGTPAEIDSLGTNFDFLSAYLTAAWNSNLNIEVKGFSEGTLLYSTNVVVSWQGPTLIAFDYLNIDRLYFNSFGGQDANLMPNGHGENFAMDNLTFEFVPEPSSFLLTTAAALMLWPLLKRKRV